jgi:hypothetical protein
LLFVRTSGHNSTIYLYDTNVGLFPSLIYRNLGHPLDPILNTIRDMRDDLDRLPEVVSLALIMPILSERSVHLDKLLKGDANLSLDNLPVDLPRCDVVIAGKCYVEVSFVVAQVEICFSAVVEDEHLAYSSMIISISSLGQNKQEFLKAVQQLTMFGGSHGPGIDVDIWINFYGSNFKAESLEEQPRRRSFSPQSTKKFHIVSSRVTKNGDKGRNRK